MILAIVVGIAGGIGIGGMLVIRYFDALAWQRSLIAFRLFLPADLGVEHVTDWLTGIAASTHPMMLGRPSLPPVVVEISASTRGIAHYLLVARQDEGKLLAGLRAAMPGARIEEAADYLAAPIRPRLAAEAIMTSYIRPLAVERAEMASTALLAALQPVSASSEIRYQLIMTSDGTPPRVTTPKLSRRSRTGWWDGGLPDDAEAVQAARLKQKEALLKAVIRVGVAAPTEAQARALLGRVWPVLHTSNAPSVRIRRRWLPSSLIAARMIRRAYPITWWPMRLNTAEAVGLAGLPVGNVSLPGLTRGTARQLPPPQAMPVRGLVVGASNYPGLAGRPLALATPDRLRHTFVLGPTGSGKSWLLTHMILQDIAAGRGVFAIDPKGDLITDILARIDERDAERIVVLDASRRDQPIGFNVLARTGSEEARELTVDSVLQVFKEIWAAFWGPRSDQIMRAALSTLVHTRADDGSAMTLCELLPLLTQPTFRRSVVGQPTLPVTLRPFWQWYEQISDGERLQAVGPVSNKVEAFTGRTPIRLMLGQSTGLDLTSIFREQSVVLVSLAKGTLGGETANLLGALLVSSLWQATMARVRVAADRRAPTFAYIDEAADIMRLPIALSDMLAQARGLGLGIIAATQLIDQVPNSVKAAMLGSATRHIPVVIEIVATGRGISHYIAIPRFHARLLLSQAQNMLPGIRAEEAPDYLADDSIIRAAGELRLTSTSHPLGQERVKAASGALLSALQPLRADTTIRISWILAGTPTPHPAGLAKLAPDLARAHRLKERSPLIRACGRVAVSGTPPQIARALLYRVYSAVRVLDGPGSALVRRVLPWRVVRARIRDRSIPITIWPAILNTQELAGLLGFPIDDVRAPGLALGAARQLPPSPDLPRSGLVLAQSNYPGMTARPLALRQADRLQHLWLLGPTGTGKSTLIANMAIQDARAGYGMIVIDPKSDLCDDILARLPEERAKDVVVLNPAATDQPIGFNILQSGRDEHSRELVVDDVVRIFAEVWKSSFGPRTADVLRSALLTLTATHAPDGSAFTLAEVAPLLENQAFRRFVTGQAGVPESVRPFWTAFEAMSASERNQTISPSMNKLRALTTRTSLRLMLGQPRGIDVGDVFTKRRILLGSLNKGVVGSETAQLLGSLVVASLWNAALRRAAIPKAARRPVWAYLDEFQDVLRMGGDVADALAQARGLGLGLTLAHQYLGQLPPAMQAAVLGTVRSSVTFQLDSEDARALERRFAPSLTTDDLTGLRAYEVAARLCVDSQTREPVTGRTQPLGEPTRDAFASTLASRERFGTLRADVEAALHARVSVGQAVVGKIGKRKGGNV